MELGEFSPLFSHRRGSERRLAGTRDGLPAFWSSHRRFNAHDSDRTVGLRNGCHRDGPDESARRARCLSHRKGTLRNDTARPCSRGFGCARDGDHRRCAVVGRPCRARSDSRCHHLGTTRGKQSPHVGRRQRAHCRRCARSLGQRNARRTLGQGHCVRSDTGRRNCGALRGLRHCVERGRHPTTHQRSSRRSTFPVTLSGNSSTNCTFVGHL